MGLTDVEEGGDGVLQWSSRGVASGEGMGVLTKVNGLGGIKKTG